MSIVKKTYLLIPAVAAIFAIYAISVYASARAADNLASRGATEYRAGKYDAAERSFMEAIARRPAYAQAWMNLGVARWEKGDADGAVEAFEKFVQLAPSGETSLEVRKRLVDIYVDASSSLSVSGELKLSRAAAHLEEFIRQAPEETGAYMQMGRIMILQGKHATALEYFDKASKLAGGSGGEAVHQRLAEIYRSLGRTDLAEKESGMAASSDGPEAALTENM